ncbi:hypothetical protein RJ639_043261 [Escallonia herrerae]|uniref:Uncharacterized protein n=1 Tax=Escallonia herrerae TaxID=1293975 RepID=A0AA88WCS3_9ASTE|nr:hypothetical protein RJ639_043261 [Escallonia herrerae]
MGSQSFQSIEEIDATEVSDLNHEGLKASQITRVVNVMKPSEEADCCASLAVGKVEFCSGVWSSYCTSGGGGGGGGTGGWLALGSGV